MSFFTSMQPTLYAESRPYILLPLCDDQRYQDKKLPIQKDWKDNPDFARTKPLWVQNQRIAATKWNTPNARI